MEKEFTAIIKQDGKWWIGWIEEIPGVNCQEYSHSEFSADPEHYGSAERFLHLSIESLTDI